MCLRRSIVLYIRLDFVTFTSATPATRENNKSRVAGAAATFGQGSSQFQRPFSLSGQLTQDVTQVAG
jgi:hypothetical protein